MPQRHDDVLAFLAARRSVPARLLTAPAPEGAALDRLLTTALRVPDHGKMEPWRLLVLRPAALAALRAPLQAALAAASADDAALAKGLSALDSPLVVAVIFSPAGAERIPLREQFMSAANVAFALSLAAAADGWGVAWLTGALAEPAFARAHLGLGPDEEVVGLIHIGSYAGPPVPDRPRPVLADKVTHL